MRTSHPSPKGNFFIKIHLSCNFSVHKYVVSFFFSPDKSITFPILERETPTKRSCMFTIWLSYLPDVSEAVFWLACML